MAKEGLELPKRVDGEGKKRKELLHRRILSCDASLQSRLGTFVGERSIVLEPNASVLEGERAMAATIEITVPTSSFHRISRKPMEALLFLPTFRLPTQLILIDRSMHAYWNPVFVTMMIDGFTESFLSVLVVDDRIEIAGVCCFEIRVVMDEQTDVICVTLAHYL